MTVVVGTAGHIDHGKTALLHALTGIDADRLPEERRRGMTIDVGYAHFALGDGSELDFVDVPGHDRLVGNMLVGAGEIDAVMLVVAADDGPRAQTVEHVALLDALGIGHGIVVITKADVVTGARVAEVREAVERLLAPTMLAGSPILIASSVTGHGIEDVRVALEELRDRVVAGRPIRAVAPGPSTSRLAVDRIFSIKGRGLVVTGTLGGGPLVRNATLRLVPGGTVGRAREVQVHGRVIESAGGGRTAVNLAGIDAGQIHRGHVLTDDPGVVASDRLLVLLREPLPDRARGRLHLGTAAVDATVGRSGHDAIDLGPRAVAAVLRLAAPIAVASGDRFVLRHGAGRAPAIGGVVLDVAPPRGIARRRQTEARVASLATAIEAGDETAATAARLDLHGAIVTASAAALAEDVREAAATDVVAALGAWAATPEARPGLAEVRARGAQVLRRLATLRRDEAALAAEALITDLVARGRLVRDGEHVGLPGAARPEPAATDPMLAAAMDRLVVALGAPSPPSLQDTARAVGCPAAGIRELARTGRIVLLDDDLAYEAATYRSIEALALDLARQAPLTPARLRDATATSRKYVMAILADLGRRDVLRRTETGHVPRAPSGIGRGGFPGLNGGQRVGRRGVIDRRVSAIVLAGGRSSRFGRDKLVEPIRGRPLLHHAIDAVRPFATEILVVTGPDGSPAVPSDVRVVHDPSPSQGPLIGLAAGVDQAAEAVAFVTAGDMPELVPAVVELLLRALDDSLVDVAVLADGTRPRPLPMAIRREAALAATRRLIASGERRLFALIDALDTVVIDELAWRAVDPDRRSMRDIDTTADLP